MIEVVERKTGRHFNCIPQMVDLNFNRKYVLRYNIGINGHSEWTFVEAIYDNNDFNERYEVVK